MVGWLRGFTGPGVPLSERGRSVALVSRGRAGRLFFPSVYDLAHGSRMLRTLKRGVKNLSLKVGYEDPIW